jgi:hypothetical protein
MGRGGLVELGALVVAPALPAAYGSVAAAVAAVPTVLVVSVGLSPADPGSRVWTGGPREGWPALVQSVPALAARGSRAEQREV